MQSFRRAQKVSKWELQHQAPSAPAFDILQTLSEDQTGNAL